MKYPLLALSLWAVAVCPAAAGRGRVQSVPAEAPVAPIGSVPGLSGGTAAGANLGLAAPTLLPPSIAAPVDPVAFAEAEAVGVQPAAVAVAAAAHRLAPAPILAPKGETVRLPASAIRQQTAEPRIPGVFGGALEQGKTNAADGPGEDSSGSDSLQAGGSGASGGNILFDGARKIGATLLSPLSGVWRGWRGADALPGFPGKVGDRLRVGGKRFQLEVEREAPSGQSLFVDRRASHEPTLIRFYAAEASPAYEIQRAALLELAKTDIPHNRLIASNDAGRVLVQESFDENESFALRPGKAMSYSQWTALPDLFFRLIAQGKTADLSAGNIKWSHWRGYWALQNAESFEDGNAWDVLGQWLYGGRAAEYGADAVELLRALRGRYGADSPVWNKIVREGQEIAAAKKVLDALGRRDAARPPPPALSFTASASPDARLGDALVSESEMRRRLGFSPLRSKGVNLHFDKGKLNTSIMEVTPQEGVSWVRKIASRQIIQNELFLRKVVHRWFGAYFETPWSLAVYNGFDSYMMMQKVAGGHWGRGRFTGKQRVALAILMNTFGVGDVNLGNIMSSPDSKKPVLIDFEQALSAKHAVTNRIPDQGILTEMPWVDTGGTVDTEYYQRGITQWRALFAEPGTQSELRGMLADSGFSAAEAEALLLRFRSNILNLPYTLQADAEFANFFYRGGH